MKKLLSCLCVICLLAMVPLTGLADLQYFLDSDTRRITESELWEWDRESLSFMFNEIFARHGYIFQDAGLRQYFEGKSWYNGTVSPAQFTSSMLSDVEQANIKLIQKYE